MEIGRRLSLISCRLQPLEIVAHEATGAASSRLGGDDGFEGLFKR